MLTPKLKAVKVPGVFFLILNIWIRIVLMVELSKKIKNETSNLSIFLIKGFFFISSPIR